MDERIYPASITKLFTAYVALQYLDAATQITVGNAIYTVPPDSSLAFLTVGDVLTVEDLIHGMLLPSGGDAARVIAAEAGKVICKNSNLPDVEAIQPVIREEDKLWSPHVGQMLKDAFAQNRLPREMGRGYTE